MEADKLTLGRSECFFLKNNVQVKNGNLMLITKKEKLKLADKDGLTRKMKYTSGFVHSFRKFSQKYGYFEARIKLPQAKGLWPAFWLMPDRSMNAMTPYHPKMRSTYIENGSPAVLAGKGMEIDIMEYLTEWEAKKFHYAAHWDGFGEDLKSHRSYHHVKTKTKDGYRKFGLYWAENLLVWFIDDVEIARWQDPRITDVPMYLIFSTNVGGWATSHVQKKKLPDYTLVDYVRVWQRL
jgi:beta-glucanase (GH16 family)